MKIRLIYGHIGCRPDSLSNTPYYIVIGSLGRTLNLSGETLTSLRYSGPLDDIANDLVINLGVDATAMRIDVVAG